MLAAITDKGQMAPHRGLITGYAKVQTETKKMSVEDYPYIEYNENVDTSR